MSIPRGRQISLRVKQTKLQKRFHFKKLKITMIFKRVSTVDGTVSSVARRVTTYSRNDQLRKNPTFLTEDEFMAPSVRGSVFTVASLIMANQFRNNFKPKTLSLCSV